MFSRIWKKMEEVHVSTSIMAILIAVLFIIILQTNNVIQETQVNGEMTLEKQIVAMLLIMSCVIAMIKLYLEIFRYRDIGKAAHWA